MNKNTNSLCMTKVLKGTISRALNNRLVGILFEE